MYEMKKRAAGVQGVVYDIFKNGVFTGLAGLPFSRAKFIVDNGGLRDCRELSRLA